MIKIGSKKCRDKFQINEKLTENTEELPKISVVVPARNEEKNIENCISSLLNSNYSKNLYEIIVVNDRSTDKTLEIIEKLAENNKIIKICNLTKESKNPNLKGKPGAIQAGIDISENEIIMMTDADCEVNENWILTVATHFKDGFEKEKTKKLNKKVKPLGMVCSYTNVKSNRFFHYCQAAEWAYMHTMASAGIGLGTVLGCFGNNVSITKEAYNKIGGFGNIKFSVTEDYVLLNEVFKAGFEIRYLCDKNSVVETLPVETFSEYMTQHKRWAIGGADLGWKAAVYVSSSICLWIAILLSIISGNYFLIAISISLRFLGDTLILFPIFNILRINFLKKWIPFSVIFYSFIELLMPFTLLNKTVKWKGQIFDTIK